jgi:hypothetical protein
VSKQHVFGPAEHGKAEAMQATECEIEAQRQAMKGRKARQRADHDRERLWQALVEQGNAEKG